MCLHWELEESFKEGSVLFLLGKFSEKQGPGSSSGRDRVPWPKCLCWVSWRAGCEGEKVRVSLWVWREGWDREALGGEQGALSAG